jgi:hypothetical protein
MMRKVKKGGRERGREERKRKSELTLMEALRPWILERMCARWLAF